MPKFIIHDKIACWVTFRHVIEAYDPTDAEQIYKDEGCGDSELDPVIGDCIEFLDQWLHIEPA